MKLRFILIVLLLSNDFLGMEHPQDSSSPAIEIYKSHLIKFIDSNETDIGFHIDYINCLSITQPIENNTAIEELSTKALVKLIRFWNSESREFAFEIIEKKGLQLAQNLLKFGADPRAEAIFEERIYWSKNPNKSGPKEDLSNKYQGIETSYKSTILEEARGSLRVCLKEYMSKDRK